MKYVYLHGFLSGPNSQKGRFLEARFREKGIELLRPDLNSGDFEHLTISRQMAVVQEVLDAAGEEQVVLLGSSLGGLLALLAAEKNPRVRRLVLLAPAFRFVERHLTRFTTREMERWKKEGFLELYHFHYQEYRKLSYALVEDAQKYRDLNFTRQLPVVIFHGLRDESVPYLLSVEYLQHHPMADLILLPSDHSLLDKLEVIWDYLCAFLHI